jgi:hypothetical protein
MKHLLIFLLFTLSIFAQDIGKLFLKNKFDKFAYNPYISNVSYSDQDKAYFIKNGEDDVFSFDPESGKIAFINNLNTMDEPVVKTLYYPSQVSYTLNKGSIKVWDKDFKKIRATFCQGSSHHNIKNIIRLNDKYIYLYDADGDDAVYSIDDHKKILDIIPPDNRPITEVIFISETQVMISTKGGNIYILDLTEKKIIKSFHVSDEAIFVVRQIPKTSKILCGDYKGVVKIVDIQSDRIDTIEVKFLPSISDLHITPDGQKALVLHAGKQELLDIATGKILDIYEFNLCSQVHEQYMICAEKDFKSASLIDLQNPQLKQYIPRKTDKSYINAIRNFEMFQNNNLLFIFPSSQPSIEIWDLQRLQHLLNIFILSDTDWIVVTKDGYFNASDDARQYLYVRTETNELVPIDDSTFKKYYHPNSTQNILLNTKEKK